MNVNDYPNDSSAPDVGLDAHIPSRAPSRAGSRRPQLLRTISSPDLLPEIPLLNTQDPSLMIRTPSSYASDSDDDDEDDLDFKPLPVALPPLCPPSPISPTSSASSGSDLDSPSSSEEDLHLYPDEPAFDDFPLPPRIQEGYFPPPPAPPPSLATLPAPTPLLYHGLSRSALVTCREFWDRRFRLWHAWRAHVDHLDAVRAHAEHPFDGPNPNPDAAHRYPVPPVLPRTRALPGQPTNGVFPGAAQETREDRVRVQMYSPYAPIFPRMGDLDALRVPYADWPDRAFLYHPTYSIAKTLFLHDMLERAARAYARAVESPASAYSDACDAPAAPPFESSPRPWEVDWRARWEVLISRQPHPPIPYPHPQDGYTQAQAHGPYPHDPAAHGYPEEEGGEGPFVWQPQPQMEEDTQEAEGPVTQTQDAGALVQGWRAEEREDPPVLVPVVKLPGHATSAPGASGALSVSAPTPMRARSLADELARAVFAEAEADIVDGDEMPPRPTSPAPRFFFHEVEDEEGEDEEDADGDLGALRVGPALDAMALVRVGVSVRPVSC